jgi:hypothetical protein
MDNMAETTETKAVDLIEEFRDEVLREAVASKRATSEDVVLDESFVTVLNDFKGTDFAFDAYLFMQSPSGGYNATVRVYVRKQAYKDSQRVFTSLTSLSTFAKPGPNRYVETPSHDRYPLELAAA